MIIILSEEVKRQLSNIKKKDGKLLDKVHKQLELFIINSKHPSLRTHKLSGKLGDSWSISIDRKIRFVYKLINTGDAYFYKLGSHDDVYKK